MAMSTKQLVKAAKVNSEETAAKLRRSRESLRAEFDDLLGSLSGKVTDLRAELAATAEDGAAAVEDGVDSMVKKTRKGIRSLDRRWRKMDGKQKIALAGGLLAVLAAAAAAPAVVKKLRKR